jgi:hypothetical protein
MQCCGADMHGLPCCLGAAAGSKLYILNANFKCDKEAGCAPEEGGTIALLRQVAASFDAGASQ